MRLGKGAGSRNLLRISHTVWYKNVTQKTRDKKQQKTMSSIDEKGR